MHSVWGFHWVLLVRFPVYWKLISFLRAGCFDRLSFMQWVVFMYIWWVRTEKSKILLFLSSILVLFCFPIYICTAFILVNQNGLADPGIYIERKEQWVGDILRIKLEARPIAPKATIRLLDQIPIFLCLSWPTPLYFRTVMFKINNESYILLILT